MNPKDDEEEETGDIDVYVSYKDGSTTVNSIANPTLKLSRAKNGRLVLTEAQAKDCSRWHLLR